MFKLYKTYNKAKNIFVKPQLKWEFGRWRNTSGLPVWRTGPRLYLYRLFRIDIACIDTSESTCFAAKYKWTETFKKEHPIFSKIFKPTYQLPIWLSFYIFDNDVIWKWKYDEIRFEFPPQFTVVFFGFALTLMLIEPSYNGENKNFADIDSYWEGILNYIHNGNSLRNAIDKTGYCTTWDTDKKEHSFWCLKPQFIKPSHLSDYYSIKSELNLQLSHEGEINLPN